MLRGDGIWAGEPLARLKRARQTLAAFLFEEIERRRAAPDLAERDDVLSLLLLTADEVGPWDVGRK